MATTTIEIKVTVRWSKFPYGKHDDPDCLWCGMPATHELQMSIGDDAFTDCPVVILACGRHNAETDFRNLNQKSK